MIAPRSQNAPRAVLVSMSVAAVFHLLALVDGLRNFHHIPAWHWAVMLVADLVVCLVAVERSGWFRVSTFRLPGVAVTSLSLTILAPLPAAVRRYERLMPPTSVLSIAGGMIVFAAVAYIATSNDPPERRLPSGPRAENLGWWIVVMAAVLLPIWILSIGSIPLLNLVRGTSVESASAAREQALRALGNAPLRLLVGSLRNIYLMFAAAFVAALGAQAIRRGGFRARTRLLIPAALVGFIALSYALITTERALLGEYVLAALVAWLVVRGRRMRVGHVVSAVTVGLAFPMVYALLAGAGSASDALKGLIRRVFYLPSDVMVHYFIEVPRFRDFLMGTTIPKQGLLTGQPTVDLSKAIYDHYYRHDPKLEGIANGSFFGVGWANFGFVGVLVWCAIAALAVVFLERFIRGLAPLSAAALRGVAAVQAIFLNSSDLTRSLLGIAPGFLDLVVLLAVLRWVDRKMAHRSTERASIRDGTSRVPSVNRQFRINRSGVH